MTFDCEPRSETASSGRSKQAAVGRSASRRVARRAAGSAQQAGHLWVGANARKSPDAVAGGLSRREERQEQKHREGDDENAPERWS